MAQGLLELELISVILIYLFLEIYPVISWAHADINSCEEHSLGAYSLLPSIYYYSLFFGFL